MERNIKFIILMIIIFLFFNISLTTSFKDFFSVIWQNQTDCKNSLNVRLLTDQIKIDLPRDKQCNDLSAELKIEDNQFCYSKDFKMISQIYTQINSYGNISCIVFLKKLGDASCCKWDSGSCIPMGEMTDKYWDLKLGYNDGGVPIFEQKFKVISNDDLIKECQEIKKQKRGLYLGIPLTIITAILAFFTKKKYRILFYIGIILGVTSSIIGLLGWW